ncbi:MAG: ribonuclease Y [Candidatus Dormibacteria bacterium]
MQNLLPAVALGLLLGAGAGIVAAYFFLRGRGATVDVAGQEARALQFAAEAEANRAESERIRAEAERVKKEQLLEAKEEAVRLRAEADQEVRAARVEIQQGEKRLQQKEENLDRRLADLERRDQLLAERSAELDEAKRQAEELRGRQQGELERIARMTQEQAREFLLDRLERELQTEMGLRIRQAEADAREESDRKARMIIAESIQRLAAEQAAEISVSVVALPSDDMKGRIIGREGRNIRALQNATGIDLIVDDTPEAVIISGFDPVRREIARTTLNRLIVDGRIHPARIEEMVDKARSDVEVRIKEEGENAFYELGLPAQHPELVRLLGTLKFRTSYGQAVLNHSKEVAYLAGMIAAELGANVAVAKEAGLLHDLGKAVDHEVEGPHAVIGAEILRKLGRPAEVVHAVRAHHFDEEPATVEAILVLSADAISASRPGARRDTLESYIKRLEKLEAIANAFEGVEKSYAIQAGREIRIMVRPEKVDDPAAQVLARQIVKQIEAELQYPGQIKVTVVRETRAVDYAK